MPSPSQSPKLLDRVRRTCRRNQYSLHTERAYVRWIIRFVRFHDTTHPRRLDEADVRTIQKLLGHEDLSTTMKYVHVLEQSGDGVTSPLDTLGQDGVDPR